MEGRGQMLAIARSRDTWCVWSVFVAVNEIYIHHPELLFIVLMMIVS